MLKLRLKPTGRIKEPSYRIIVIENKARRNGNPVECVGYYSPISKKSYFNIKKIQQWLKQGVKPTPTAFNLLKKANIIKN